MPQKYLDLLVIDDEEGVRIASTHWLQQAGYKVQSAASAEEALPLLKAQHWDIVLCDVRMPGLSGLELLDLIQSHEWATAVIVMSAFGDDRDALAAIRRGAYDYLPKPFGKEALLLCLGKLEERERLIRENKRLKALLEGSTAFENIVAQSAVMKELFRLIQKVALYDASVLVTGESGTGKELVSQAIHRLSPRKDKPFVAVNCAAIPETLLESELFGHSAGAFTGATKAKIGLFEEAHGGTLFLDEISSMPLNLQAKLLRVLQEKKIRRLGENRLRKVDVRVIAASLDDLNKKVEEGSFREDLFYRLNVIPIHIPPLRARREDIPLLAEHFLAQAQKRLHLNIKGFTQEALQAMYDYYWPGNVRELQNVVERAAILTEGLKIGLQALPPDIRRFSSSTAEHFLEEGEVDLSIKRATRRLEKRLITLALRKTQGNRSQAAKLLELSPRALAYKIRDYELQDIQ